MIFMRVVEVERDVGREPCLGTQSDWRAGRCRRRTVVRMPRRRGWAEAWVEDVEEGFSWMNAGKLLLFC